MARSDDQCVVPHERGWAIKTRGSRRSTEIHARKLLAIDRAVSIARRQECFVAVHDHRGKQQARWDPLSEPEFFFVTLA